MTGDLIRLQEASKSRLGKLKKQLNLLVWGRLFSFLFIPLWFYIFQEQMLIALIGALVIAGLFLFLVKRYMLLDNQRIVTREKIALLKNELEAADGLIYNWPEGKEYKDSDHAFTDDLDVFGPDSLFQRVCRSITPGAESLVAAWLRSQTPSPENWTKRKDAVAEWEGVMEARVDLLTHASLLKKEKKNSGQLLELVKNELGVNVLLKTVIYLIPTLSLIAILLYSMDVINEQRLVMYFLLSLGVTGIFIRKINAVYNDWSNVLSLMKNYSEMFAVLSKQNWNAPGNVEIKDKAQGAERALSGLSGIISTFDQRNNQLLGIPLNALVAMDLQQVYRLHKWKQRYGERVAEWIEAMNNAEALASVASFTYLNRERLCNAKRNEGGFQLQMEELVHPFMRNAVSNSLSFGESDGIVIVTGANMAGKSTFLRAVGTNIILANLCGKACAKTFIYSDLELFSSMRSTDSVQRGQSYFFNELSRLKKLVEFKSPEKPLFVLLDEILKGTNSVDKARGSWLFVERLLEDEIRGIVATHDLSLTELLNDHPQQIRNMRFEVDITSTGLHFDYTLKDGVCQTMNASWLLKEMELTPRKGS